jgi:3-hydroxy-9,10-secoandrosta-1,3,5(10)-triene-9,17-dione monooxygenase
MTSPTSSDVLSRARALIPTLRAREAAATAARDVPRETIDDFHRAGLLRLLQPRRFGGQQTSVGLFLQAVEILAEGCAASAWAYGVLAELEWVIACFPERAQLDIWGDDQNALAAASIVPRGVGILAPGGWRVTGRYGFASACRHAKWLILGVRCEDPNGTDVPRYLAVPTQDAEILDDWHALGMRGTGSFGVALHDVFVPEHRSVPIADIVAGTVPGRLVHPDYAVIRAPRYYLVPFLLPAVGFGIANRALATVPTALRARGQPTSDAAHLRLGEAATLIESAHLIFTTRRDASVGRLDSGARITEADILRNRRDVALAFRMIRQGVEHLVVLTGARAVYDTDPLQALWRDLITIGTHIIVNEQEAMVPYGRFLLRPD